jgi:hypothetical protein
MIYPEINDELGKPPNGSGLLSPKRKRQSLSLPPHLSSDGSLIGVPSSVNIAVPV